MPKKNSLPVVRTRISQSYIQDWNTCQYRFGKVHIEQLAKRFPTRPLTVGTLIHSGMEGFLRAQFENPGIPKKLAQIAILNAIAFEQRKFMNQDHIKSYIDNEWKETANKYCQEAADITLRCVTWLGFFNGDCDWETVAHKGVPLIEYEMLRPMEIRHGRKVIKFDLGGKLDWVARKKSINRKFLIDFKSRDQLKRNEYDHKQTQSPLYLYLLRDENIEVHGTATLQIRRAIPVKPRQNTTKPKDAKLYPMSRESIVTDWETYEAELKAVGLDPAAYQDVKAKLKPFFSISPELRSDTEIANVMEDVMRAAFDILTTPQERFYRARYPMNCEGCDFEELCTAEILGHDDAFIRKAMFYDRTKPEFISVDMEEDDNFSYDNESFSR